jgi:hypothetical protein
MLINKSQINLNKKNVKIKTTWGNAPTLKRLHWHDQPHFKQRNGQQQQQLIIISSPQTNGMGADRH